MSVDLLTPQLDLLSREQILVQAWKKTASYIRYHNWYADTLELDQATVNLPNFISELAERFSSPESWSNDFLRIVPAPKSQQWQVKNGLWGPSKGAAVSLRPLAHVSLRDQVAATAIMMCLADRVETLQGDPRSSIQDREKRQKVISYGNRLFCDAHNQGLSHRWGTAKLYRAYFQDYRTFLTRPEVVAEEFDGLSKDSRIVVLHSDLRQFFDRVSPELITSKLSKIIPHGNDTGFLNLTSRLLNWRWDPKDTKDVAAYAKQSKLEDFSRVALPQGLVASGFFANIALLDFDQALQSSFYREIIPGVMVLDVSRYVDDLRIVLSVDQDNSLDKTEDLLADWLQSLLVEHAPGMLISPDKTKAAVFRGDERPLIRQSNKMERIQEAVSGGFDAIGGEEILNAVQGLVRSQQRYSESRNEFHGWAFSPIPDVRDTTVARFAAARYRTTYRSLRPLLEERNKSKQLATGDDQEAFEGLLNVARSQEELDDEARAFALGLIENWIEDPSNVRLLRIGLDIWPAHDILSHVLQLLRPIIDRGRTRNSMKKVAWYCLAEILRAGATETGIVEDDECLPKGIELFKYKDVLLEEALRLLALPQKNLPWFLKQQALLFVATCEPEKTPFKQRGRSPETLHYQKLISFLHGDFTKLSADEFSSTAVLSRRSYLDSKKALSLTLPGISIARIEEIIKRDPSFAMEVLQIRPDLISSISARLRYDLALEVPKSKDGWESLASLVSKDGVNNVLRNEAALLRFSLRFLNAISAQSDLELVTPSDVLVRLNGKTLEIEAVKIKSNRVSSAGSMYLPPKWSGSKERWRFLLGYLLRYILTSKPDFTRSVRPSPWKELTSTYRPPESHWYLRLYGMFNGHSAFGDNWLPISDWTERLLFSLLSWPGCLAPGVPEVDLGIQATIHLLEKQLKRLTEDQGPFGSALILRLPTSRPDNSSNSRPLRACIVQTVLPSYPKDFPSHEEKVTRQELKLSDATFRKKHRNHLSAALAAVERMLALRETHKLRDGRLDLLILPELSVHPDDVVTHLIPFARKYKTIILAGLVYEELFSNKPLVNSALWVIPVWDVTHGLKIMVRRQGKANLSPEELKYNKSSRKLLMGFRPCQWLVGYDWSHKDTNRPLWLTAAICYDATDLQLATDLRNRSDVFAIPALNKDVKTFDQMALALHYHMFQMVIIANNGDYGGSNAFAPFGKDFERQIFHLHGQPQATMAFLEIDDIGAFINRKTDAINNVPIEISPGEKVSWKYPPVGVKD